MKTKIPALCLGLLLIFLGTPCSQAAEAHQTESDSIYQFADTPPAFQAPDGQTAQAYLTQHLQYPYEARIYRVEGRIHARFVVETDGSLSQIHIMKADCTMPSGPALDTDDEIRQQEYQQDAQRAMEREVTRMLRNMPQTWRPAKVSGKPVRMWTVLPVSFKLPKGIEFPRTGTYRLQATYEEGSTQKHHIYPFSLYKIHHDRLANLLWVYKKSTPQGIPFSVRTEYYPDYTCTPNVIITGRSENGYTQKWYHPQAKRWIVEEWSLCQPQGYAEIILRTMADLDCDNRLYGTWRAPLNSNLNVDTFLVLAPRYALHGTGRVKSKGEHLWYAQGTLFQGHLTPVTYPAPDRFVLLGKTCTMEQAQEDYLYLPWRYKDEKTGFRKEVPRNGVAPILQLRQQDVMVEEKGHKTFGRITETKDSIEIVGMEPHRFNKKACRLRNWSAAQGQGYVTARYGTADIYDQPGKKGRVIHQLKNTWEEIPPSLPCLGMENGYYIVEVTPQGKGKPIKGYVPQTHTYWEENGF